MAGLACPRATGHTAHSGHGGAGGEDLHPREAPKHGLLHDGTESGHHRPGDRARPS